MSARLTIAHGNGHNRHELITFARRNFWDSFSGNETQRLTSALADMGSITVARGPAADRERSTCVVTRLAHPILGETSLRIADAMPKVNQKLHPNRALAATFYAHPIADQLDAAGVAHFSAHPPPTVMKHDDMHHPVVVAYRRALNIVFSQMRAAEAAGYLLCLTGDLQAGEHYAEPWSPANLAERLDLRSRAVEIDWIMIDKRLRFDGELKRHELFDHTGFIADMVPA